MIVVMGSSNFAGPGGVSLTVGNFDGVHLGHRELLRRAVERARDRELMAVALTFTPHPVRFFSPHARFYEITTFDEKARLIGSLGIEVLVVEPFDGGVGLMAPDEFVREVVHRRLRARHLTVGYDFTFGRNRSGTAALLQALGRELRFTVEVVPPVVRGGTIVSSTRVRELLLGGRVREAEELLCRPYGIGGRVVPGAGRGRKLGFPTANIQVEQELIPLPGVYVVEAVLGDRAMKAVANIGFNPTFGENSLGVEVHILDFDGDLYGGMIEVRFRERIRDERKFKSVDDLVRQIEKDVRYARELSLPPARPAGGTRLAARTESR